MAKYLSPVASPHLADALRTGWQRICDRWEALVREALPETDEQPFRDQIPGALSALVHNLGHVTTAAGDLGKHDLAPDPRVPVVSRIDHQMIEMSLLRRCVLEELPLHLGREMVAGEVVALCEALDLIIRPSVVAHYARQAGDLLDANERKTKYLSFLSHDLRGGLNGIFLMVEVLRRELAGRPELTQTLEDLEIMRRSIIETVATMDRFVYAERFRGGKVKARPTPFSLRTLLNEIGSRFTYGAKEQGIELKIDLAERADIISDRELLALALHGLVANAVKHTTAGSVVLSAKPAESGAGWRVDVIDTGSGIAPAELATIHALFQDPGLGHGQSHGLSLAAQAARLIGATMGAESKVGDGSRFWVGIAKGTSAP